MIITCTECGGTGIIHHNDTFRQRPDDPCRVCNETGELELTVDTFNRIGMGTFRGVAGVLIIEMINKLGDLEDKIDDLKDKIDEL
jgi:hypothetical protein